MYHLMMICFFYKDCHVFHHQFWLNYCLSSLTFQRSMLLRQSVMSQALIQVGAVGRGAEVQTSTGWIKMQQWEYFRGRTMDLVTWVHNNMPWKHALVLPYSGYTTTQQTDTKTVRFHSLILTDLGVLRFYLNYRCSWKGVKLIKIIAYYIV